MSEKDTADNQLNEPQKVYNKTIFGSFSSFEEANEADAANMAKLSGEQHFANAHLLIKSIYKDTLQEPFDRTIKTK